MKSFFLFASIICGVLVPQAQALSFLIVFLIIFMLFVSFSAVRLQRGIFSKNIWWLLAANVAIAFGVYVVIEPFNSQLALTAFILGLAPTATAAPAVTSFLKGKVEFVIAAVIVTNVAVALAIPFLMPLVGAGDGNVSTFNIVKSVFAVIFGPLLAAQLVRRYLPRLNRQILRHGKPAAFYAWVVIIFLAVARSSHFVQTHPEISPATLAGTAALALGVCVVNFGVGRIIGGKQFGMEASQSLGQKNTMFMVWFSLSFLNPLVALGPVVYLVYHNIYNSYQMISRARLEKSRSVA